MISQGRVWPWKDHLTNILATTVMMSSTAAIVFVGKRPLIEYHNEEEWLSPFFLLCLIMQIEMAH
jgi:hypothetical protein